jgi:hypothetical protein
MATPSMVNQSAIIPPALEGLIPLDYIDGAEFDYDYS